MTRRDTDLGTMTAGQLLDLYRRGAASPVEATAAALARIARFNPAVNAYCHVDEEGALAAARDSEARWRAGTPCGPLDGVPASVKDLTPVRGMPVRRGSRTADDAPAAADAPFAAHMRAAGAVLLGKTTTPEFGWKGVTDSPLTGITRNPWDPALTPGGSSGGAGAAAALNMGVLHQGSDAGGSIRIPCAFTGTAGIKPTFGYVPQWPASAMGTLSHLGPMARTVGDVARLLAAVGRPDDRDWLAGAPFERDWEGEAERGVRGLRVAYSRTLGYAAVRPDVARAVDAAVARLGDLGAVVEEADPGFADPLPAFDVLWQSGAAKILANLPAERRALVDPGLRAVAEAGARHTAVDYLRAVDERGALAERMAAFHRRWDVLVTPTMPITAFAAGQEVPPGSGLAHWTQWTPFTYPFNMTQQPAASVPCGAGDDGMPVGLHIVAARFADATVLRVARAVEAALPPAFPETVAGAG
ncbi:amidase [Azospirillum sp. ST 5-10]|uniref:amidase n=1 Tax=unclassified Azospirillum TaxID=2630922 RepID=UPI003F4A1229